MQADSLLQRSDAIDCKMTSYMDARFARESGVLGTHATWLPSYVSDSAAGVQAFEPRAAPSGCWPDKVPRSSTGPPRTSRFYISTCAPTNANELVRTRAAEVGARGKVCSRSHQIFFNTTKKSTGTYERTARQSCRSP